MRELTEYIRHNAVKHPRGTVEGSLDVVFFEVQAKSGARPEMLRKLLLEHVSTFIDVDVFDGDEHGYIELGAWLGSQEDALALIGLGAQLKLWNLLTPRTVLGAGVAADIEEQLARKGLVSLQVPRDIQAAA